MIIAITSVVVKLVSRTTRENEKSLFLVSLEYGFMFLIIILGSYSQYVSYSKDKQYKIAQLELEILPKVSEYYFPVFEGLLDTQNNFLTVKNYLSYERAKKKNPDLVVAINWHKDASKKQIRELDEAKKSLQNIKLMAAEIIKIGIEYEGVLPEQILEWAGTTLKIDFENIEEYLDPYASVGGLPKPTVVNYFRKTGEAFDHVIRRIKHSVDVIQDI
jgi:hypothetical protein